MVTLDSTRPQTSTPPYLVKIDVQGAELEVLEGATELLKETDVVIVETSLISTVKNSPEIDEVIAYMSRHDFKVFDIIDSVERPLDRNLAQVDLMFVKRLHAIRNDNRWTS